MAPVGWGGVHLPSHMRSEHTTGGREEMRGPPPPPPPPTHPPHPYPRGPEELKSHQDIAARFRTRRGGIAAGSAREPPLEEGTSRHTDQALKSDRIDIMFPAALQLWLHGMFTLANLPILAY